jgi:hypothetical protein
MWYGFVVASTAERERALVCIRTKSALRLTGGPEHHGAAAYPVRRRATPSVATRLVFPLAAQRRLGAV